MKKIKELNPNVNMREQFFHKTPLIGRVGLLGKMGVFMIPRFVELRPGNVCNVQVLAPASSSKWLEDYKDIVQKADFINKGYLGLNFPDDFKWAEDDNFYNDLYDSAPNLELLYINGGEPNINKTTLGLLEKVSLKW